MFTQLDLKNFRAFESVELALAPITIFVGPNNSGKSSILSALRVLAQTMRNEDYRIPLLLNGPFGQFGTYRNLVYQNVKERRVGIALASSVSRRGTAKEVKLALSFSYRTQRREVILRESTLTDETGHKVYATKNTSDPQRHIAEFFGLKNGTQSVPGTTKRVRLFHFVLPPYQIATGARLSVEQGRAYQAADAGFQELVQSFRYVEYLGPFRAEPKRTNLFSGESPTSVGVDGARAIDMLASDYLRRGRKKRKSFSIE